MGLRFLALLVAVYCLAGLLMAFAALPGALYESSAVWGTIVVGAGFLLGLLRVPWIEKNIERAARPFLSAVPFVSLLLFVPEWLKEATGVNPLYVAGALWPLAGAWMAYHAAGVVRRLWHHEPETLTRTL